jgi:N-acetylglucosaminyldiphosphoundecaprenol N-acetyl-beta-D-mannosaminyltransferase
LLHVTFGEEKKVPAFFYGGPKGVAERLVDNLINQFPDMEVAGTYSPPFRPLTEEEDNEIVRMINNSEADVIWVGLGAPNVESTTSTNMTLMGRT